MERIELRNSAVEEHLRAADAALGRSFLTVGLFLGVLAGSLVENRDRPAKIQQCLTKVEGQLGVPPKGTKAEIFLAKFCESNYKEILRQDSIRVQ